MIRQSKTLAVSYLLVCFGCSRLSAQELQRYYTTRMLTDTSLIHGVYEYRNVSSDTLNLAELLIWPEATGRNPSEDSYLAMPDYKRVLLENGFAQLRDSVNADTVYLRAQRDAQRKKVGMWQPRSAQPNTGTSPQVDTARRPAVDSTRPATPAGSPSSGNRFIRIFHWLLNAAIAVIGAFGIREIFTLLLALRKRNKIKLLLLGQPAAGKTWLWSRLTHPDITPGELETIQITSRAERRQADTIEMGRYEIQPLFVDLPGKQPATHLSEMLSNRQRGWLRKHLIREKTIWLIVLSSTDERSKPGTVSQSFLDQQFGYLALPLAALGADKVPKPSMLIVCLAKFDFHSAHPPMDSASQEVRDELHRVFGPHVERVKEECKNQRVPFEVVFVSARFGWGGDRLRDVIRNRLFEKRSFA